MEDNDEKLTFLGKLAKTPCAYEFLLHGLAGSATSGLLFFLVTSRIRTSFHVANAGFFFSSMGSWFYCRYNYAKKKIENRVLTQGARNMVMYQGTDLDPRRNTADK